MVIERLLALGSAGFLLCCSGGVEPYGPASGPGVLGLASGQPSDANAPSRQLAASEASGDGFLELSAAADVSSFLGSLHAVVEGADGRVVGGADEEAATPGGAKARNLSLVLPAGDDYTVVLTATTGDAQPTTCRASVVGLRIEAGATARAQIFSWDCGDVSGYVPAALDGDCYWLADWSFITRTRAAIGDVIAVGVAGHDLGGSRPTFTWSTASPDHGTFQNPAAAQTSFRCQAAADDLSLTVQLAAAGCEQKISQTVSCR